MAEKRSRLLSFVYWLPIPLLLIFIAYEYFTYIVFLCWFSVPDWPTRILLLSFGHLFFFLWLWSYSRTILAPVARPSARFNVPEEIHSKLMSLKRYKIREDAIKYMAILTEFMEQNNLTVFVREYNGFPRYCQYCRVIKPDRCHHCSTCGHCVLRFDHHCPWLNNCVNHSNYKFFVLTLLHTEILGFYAALSGMKWIIEGVVEDPSWFESPRVMSLIVMSFIALVYSLTTACLLIFHLTLIARNRATLDDTYCEGFRIRNGAVVPDPFDRGTLDNFKGVFGHSLLLWLLPIRIPGSGEFYPLREDWESFALSEKKNK